MTKSASRNKEHDLDKAKELDGQEKTFFVFGNTIIAPKIAPGLYVVSTPIGNLRDMTLRALESLAGADLIACEDTRVSRKLLSHYGIHTRLIAYHEHNADKQRPVLLEAIIAGKAVALISDAGTPLLSDPGYKLVQDMVAEGHSVIPIPGASAMLTGLVASGLPTDQIHFAGFLPQKAGARKTRLEALTAIPGTLVFYESPRRLSTVLPLMAKILGPDRPAVMARELTKAFEEFRRDSLANLADYYAASEAPKGEVVLLVGPGKTESLDQCDLEALINKALDEKKHVKDIANDLARMTGEKKNEIYNLAQRIKEDRKAEMDRE